MPVNYALLFPGQGSQRPGMGRELFDVYEAAREIFELVSAATGLDLPALCFESDEATLRKTENAQIALYTVGVAACACLIGQPPISSGPVGVAGHSVGEYAALACAGVISIADGAKLVRRRGDLMARAGALRPGAMAAIIGSDETTVERICAEVSSEHRAVVVANYNCPGQVVISGDSGAVQAACERLSAEGAKRCLPLNVSGAFHSPLMQDAAQAMAEALALVRFTAGNVPVISNVTADVGTDWRCLLERQLASPVRWSQSLQRLSTMGAVMFIECGPGDVLCGLVRRTLPGATCLQASTAEGVAEAREAIGA